MWIRTLFLTAVSMLATWAPATLDARTATTAEKAACEAKIQPRIDRIDARLRAGYSAKEGERLRADRRRLQVEKAACRRVS